MADKFGTSKEEHAQQQYYDAISKEYDSHFGSQVALDYRARVYDLILDKLDTSGMTVLDAMCGGGEATSYFNSRGANCVGVDISYECCRAYAARHGESQVACCSILNTAFADRSFDLVMTDSLHHLHPWVNPGIEEIHRILKPGGYFCCWEPAAGSIFDAMRKLWYRLDPKYFEENEAAIDGKRLQLEHSDKFRLVAQVYGGNVGYLAINGAMALRLPVAFVERTGPFLSKMEGMVNRIQPRALSLWFLMLLQRV